MLLKLSLWLQLKTCMTTLICICPYAVGASQLKLACDFEVCASRLQTSPLAAASNTVALVALNCAVVKKRSLLKESQP